MNIFDKFFGTLGYTKAKPPRYPEWLLQYADAAAPGYPNFTPATNKLEYFEKVSWVNIAVNTVSTIGAGVNWNVKKRTGEDMKDIPNHDFEKLLQKPNPGMSQDDLIFSTMAYLSVCNTAYWWLNIVGGRPKEIWLIPNKQISPIPDGKMWIKGYDYDPGDGQYIRLDPREVVPFIGFNPNSMFEGFSPLDPLRMVASGDLGMQAYNERVYVKGGGINPSVLAFADPIPDDDWQVMQDDVSKAARMRTYLMLRNVRAGGVQWIQGTASQKDMDFLASRLQNRDEIFASLAPGLSSLISPNASRENSTNARATLIDLKVYPMLRKIGSVITNSILPMYAEGLVCEPEDIRVIDTQARLAEITEYSKTHTVDEVRQKYWQSDPIETDEIGEMLVSAAQTHQPKGEENETMTPPPQFGQPTQQPAEPVEQPAEQPPVPQAAAMEEEAEPEPVKADIYPAMLEIDKWERKAKKANGRPFEFVSCNIPLEVAEAIRAGMSFDDARKMLKSQPAEVVGVAAKLAELIDKIK